MQYNNVQQLALENNNFRKVLFTNEHSQVVLMSVLPGEDIGREVHKTVDQVLVFVKGAGQAVVGPDKHDIGPGGGCKKFCVNGHRVPTELGLARRTDDQRQKHRQRAD